MHNPYSSISDAVKKVPQLFEGYGMVTPSKTGRKSERGDLIDYFTYKVNEGRVGRKDKDGRPYKPINKSFIAMQLGNLRLTVRDLYYLKSVSEDYERRKGNWGKFYWAIVRQDETQDPMILEVRNALSLSTG